MLLDAAPLMHDLLLCCTCCCMATAATAAVRWLRCSSSSARDLPPQEKNCVFTGRPGSTQDFPPLQRSLLTIGALCALLLPLLLMPLLLMPLLLTPLLLLLWPHRERCWCSYNEECSHEVAPKVRVFLPIIQAKVCSSS